MNLGERLVQLRKEHNYTRESFAQMLGISKYTLRNYELGVTEPGHPFLIKIAEMFDTSIDYILGLTEEKERTLQYQLKFSEYDHIKKYRLLPPDDRILIDNLIDRTLVWSSELEQAKKLAVHPVVLRTLAYYGKLASAGNGEFIFDDIPSETLDVPLTEESQKADFIVGITGDSMEPTFKDGDKVLVQKTDIVETGDIGIFFIGNECFIKEAAPDGLKSHNSKYKLIPGTDRIRCVGKVLGKIED